VPTAELLEAGCAASAAPYLTPRFSRFKRERIVAAQSERISKGLLGSGHHRL